MDILLDNVIFSLQNVGGISVMWSNLLRELSAMDVDFRCLEYSAAQRNIARQELNIDADVVRRKLYSGALQKCLSVGYDYSTPFIFHSSIYRVCRNPKAINVVTVHDFIYERQSDTTWLHKQKCKLNHRAIRSADAIVCVSENTRRDLKHFLPDVDDAKVSVIYNGVSDTFRQLPEPLPGYDDYVLYVGGRQDYKNFRFAVEAVAESRYKLLVCGNALTKSEIRLLNEKLGADRYRFELNPTAQRLNELYNSVYCLIYPSSYEGFGLPVLEAQRAGCPVVALYNSSIKEVIGNHAMWMTQLSVKQFMDCLQRFSQPIARQNVIVSGMENAQRFSWRTMAESYLRLYRSLLSGAK